MEEYGIPGVVLMENAGCGAADFIDSHYGPAGDAFIACGTGNNGGDGLVIARHLHNRGWSVRMVIVGDPSRLSPDAATNDRVVQAMKLERIVAADSREVRRAAEAIRSESVVIDALLGTGLRGAPSGPIAGMIDAINTAGKRATVAIDIPSGLDCDSGIPVGPAVRADQTVTFVAMKKGFLEPTAADYVGRCSVVDIGAPREMLTRVLAEQKP